MDQNMNNRDTEKLIIESVERLKEEGENSEELSLWVSSLPLMDETQKKELLENLLNEEKALLHLKGSQVDNLDGN